MGKEEREWEWEQERQGRWRRVIGVKARPSGARPPFLGIQIADAVLTRSNIPGEDSGVFASGVVPTGGAARCLGASDLSSLPTGKTCNGQRHAAKGSRGTACVPAALTPEASSEYGRRAASSATGRVGAAAGTGP